MNLHQLRVFYAVATAGSVSQAARDLRVSQPAVSKQLSEFEAALGVRLLDRLPRGIRLSEAGRELYEHAARLFRIEAEAQQVVEKHRQEFGKFLRVGASTTIGSYLVPTLFGTLKKLEPEATLSLEIANTQNILELVRSESVDVGLTEGLAAGEEFVSVEFAEDELIAIAAPTDPLVFERNLTLEMLLARPTLVRERGSGSREVLENALLARGYELRSALDLGSTEALKNAARSRLGVAFVSSLAVDLELKSGLLVKLTPNNFELRRKLTLIELRHKTRSPLATAFAKLLASPPARLRQGEYAI
jgi:DNA-binding transcriptional LysR family regulator